MPVDERSELSQFSPKGENFYSPGRQAWVQSSDIPLSPNRGELISRVIVTR